MGKIVILGIDALNNTLLATPGMKKLKKVFDMHASGILTSVHPPTTDAAWTSFQTGMKPENHGICSFVDFNSLEQPLYTRKNIIYPTFYDIVDEIEKKQLIFNLPFSYPPSINGDIVYSWVDHGYPSERPYCPMNLPEMYPLLEGIEMFPKQKENTIETLKEMKRYFLGRAEIIREIFNAQEHDLYFFLISITDWLQHSAYIDIALSTDSEENKISNEILEEVSKLCLYIINNSDLKEDSIIIMSDHGFSKWNKAFNLNTWLLKKGHLKTDRKGKATSDVLRRRTKKQNKKILRLGKIGKWLRKKENLRKKLSPIENVASKFGLELTSETCIDFENSKAVCFSSLGSTIFINENLVDDKTDLAQEIKYQLNKIDGIDAKLVEEVFVGKKNYRMGDIYVTFERGTVTNNLESNVITKETVVGHDYKGVFCFIGDSFSSDLIGPLSIVDIFPLILHLNGCLIPEYIDGKLPIS